MPKQRRRDVCRLCDGTHLRLILSLAPTPPANAFLRPQELNQQKEEFFPLDLFFCEDCGHVQLLDVVSPELLFRNYVYVSSTSASFTAHLQEGAREAQKRFLGSAPSFVCEIGSNDGTCLRVFAQEGHRVLGVDPATEISKKAAEQGVPTRNEFFTETLAQFLRQEQGPADLILANNVFAHADDLADIARGVRALLSKSGVFIFEVSALDEVLKNTLFDTIYHEHLSYHSLTPLVHFFKRWGLRIFDARKIRTHGGSWRVFVCHEGAPHQMQASVPEALNLEQSMGLMELSTYQDFARRIEERRQDFIERIRSFRARGLQLAGFGAAAKSTTLLHHFGVQKGDLQLIVDDSPWKQGLLSPGLHIPILSSAAIQEKKPDVIVVLAWNFADEFVKSQAEFLRQGGRILIPLPQLKEVTGATPLS